jgi:hypothetical protein
MLCKSGVNLFQCTANPRYNGQNLVVHNCEILEKLRYREGFVIRNPFEIKNSPYIENFKQSHFVFLYLLHVLAMYPMVYFYEYSFIRL